MVALSPVPGDKVATGWRERIELLKLTGLLGEPNDCARYALERSRRTATSGRDCGRNKIPHKHTEKTK
jgi:hypothetical protein